MCVFERCLSSSVHTSAGLTGKTNWEQAQVEEVVDAMDDLRAEVAKWIYEKEEDKKVCST